MRFIIHGATGAQGGPVYARMLAAGLSAVAGVRDVEKIDGKPAVTLDNSSPESLVAAYEGADGVFIHLPQAPEAVRVQFARNIVAAIGSARPGRVLISTSGAIVDQPGTALQAPDDSAVMILVRGVRDSGLSHAILAPRLFLENLLLPMVFGPAQAEGVLRYPIRADFPVSWSSHLDVAELAERLLTDTQVSGIVGVGHVPGQRGGDLAAGFSAQLGRPVSFEAITPEKFGDLITPMFGPAAAGVVGLYQALSRAPANVIADETSAQKLLGLSPRSVAAWLAETLS